MSKIAIIPLKVTNRIIAEQLVLDIRGKSAVQEMGAQFSSSSGAASLMESKLQEFEIEMERMSSKIEHLRSQNDVLTMTLEESKNNCDKLTVLMGKQKRISDKN